MSDTTEMRWDAVPGLRDGHTPEDLIAWINANGGEARYEPGIQGGAKYFADYRYPRIVIRGLHGDVTVAPGDTIVMGDYVGHIGEEFIGVREFTVRRTG